jgi:hypothetical protein
LQAGGEPCVQGWGLCHALPPKQGTSLTWIFRALRLLPQQVGSPDLDTFQVASPWEYKA